MMRHAPSLPCGAGIGLRAPHYQHVLEHRPALGWVELHSENFFGGGAPLHTLRQMAELYPVSLHGVGMGLASTTPLDRQHLLQLKQLCDQIQPASVSEHLCWNRCATGVIPDLLPFPYTHHALQSVCDKVNQVQDVLGRCLLIENLSYYLQFTQQDMNEQDFLSLLVSRTGCGILLDINNLYVNSVNLQLDSQQFIRALPVDAVAEYHLAGPSWIDGCLVDTHSQAVFDEVWQLYDYALQHIGKRPTLIEWDMNIPELAVLLAEAAKAQARMEQTRMKQTWTS